MGTSYIGVKDNGLNLKKVFYELINGEVIEATEERYFYNKPSLSEVKDIAIGDGATRSILTLKNGGFVVVEKTIKSEDLKLYGGEYDQ